MTRRSRGPRTPQHFVDKLCDPRLSFAEHDEAVRAVARFRQEAVAPLLAALAAHDDPRIRGRLAAALGRTGRATAKQLIPLLDEDDIAQQKSLVMALGLIKSTSATKPLIALLERTPSDVSPDDAAEDRRELRRKIVVALGWIADLRAVEALAAVLAADPDSALRQHAAEALAKIGEPEVIGPLEGALTDADDGVRRAARDALDRLGYSS